MIQIEKMSIASIVDLCGDTVTILKPNLEGEIEEVIFDRQRHVVFKIKVWIQGSAFFHVCSPGELQLGRTALLKISTEGL